MTFKSNVTSEHFFTLNSTSSANNASLRLWPLLSQKCAGLRHVSFFSRVLTLSNMSVKMFDVLIVDFVFHRIGIVI